MHFDTVWSFSTRNLRVELQCIEEPDPDLSWADAETMANIESGFWASYLFRVRITHKTTGAQLGTDYLGNSVYENPRDFRDHIGNQGRHGSYFRDMVTQACQEARQTLRNLRAIPLH